MASRKDNYNINAVIPYVEEGQDWSALSGEAESASPPITNHTNSENDRDPPRGRILRHSQGLRPFRDTSARLPSGNSMKRMSQTIEGKTVDLAKNPSSCKENLTNGSILASGKHKRAAASRVSRAAFRPIQPKENSSSSVKMETLVRSRTGQSSVKVPALARIDIQKDDAVNFLPTCTQQTLRVDECYADFKAICRGGLSLEEAYEAESLLRSITQRYKNGLSSFRPSGKYFNYVMHAFAELGHPNAAKATLGLMLEAHEQGSLYDAPDVRVFNTLLHAWRRSKERDAPIQGELVLQHMYRLHSSYNIPCQPNLRSYTILLQCWVESNREDAADGAERIFRCMNCPDRVAYVTLLAIFTKNNATHNRAENLLWEMVGDFLNGNNGAKPYIRDFNSCMAMWSKSLADEAPHRAMRLILHLLRLNETSRLRAIPDSYTYGLLLKAW